MNQNIHIVSISIHRKPFIVYEGNNEYVSNIKYLTKTDRFKIDQNNIDVLKQYVAIACIHI